MAKTSNQQKSGGVRSADTMFDIVEYIQRTEGVTISEVASDLKYAKSTIHRHLTTLERRGYVVKEDGYYLSLRFLGLGEQARNRRDAYQLAKEKVEQLADITDERAQFLVEEHGKAVYTHRSHGKHAVRTDPGIGKRIPMHATATGKAIMAAMSPKELSRVIEQMSLEAVTDKTITDLDELHAELERIREQGYAFNREENLAGLHAVGVPVEDPEDGVIGALSVSGPSHRLTGDWFEKELPNLLLGTANELELNIPYTTKSP